MVEENGSEWQMTLGECSTSTRSVSSQSLFCLPLSNNTHPVSLWDTAPSKTPKSADSRHDPADVKTE